MERIDIENIINKYIDMSEKEYRYGIEKCTLYERIANVLEENIDKYANDDYFQDEHDLINAIVEELEEVDSFYDDEDWENIDLEDFMDDN